MNPQDPYDLTGHVIDENWRVVRKLGEGGMGEVYEIQQRVIATQFALKVLSPAYARHPIYVRRFIREAHAASLIKHDNVVGVIYPGTLPGGPPYFGRPFFIMDFLEGEDLHQLLSREGPQPWETARRMLLQIAAGLRAAHEKQVLHRDIKPANCRVLSGNADGPRIKLLDFGIAKVMTADIEAEAPLTSPEFAPGTRSYMAPELLGNTGEASIRSDIFSFGVLTYRMLVGHEPFYGPSAVDLLNQQKRSDLVPPPNVARADVPPDISALTMDMLAFDPRCRPINMGEVEVRLARANRRYRATVPRFGAVQFPVVITSADMQGGDAEAEHTAIEPRWVLERCSRSLDSRAHQPFASRGNTLPSPEPTERLEPPPGGPQPEASCPPTVVELPLFPTSAGGVVHGVIELAADAAKTEPHALSAALPKVIMGTMLQTSISAAERWRTDAERTEVLPQRLGQPAAANRRITAWRALWRKLAGAVARTRPRSGNGARPRAGGHVQADSL